MLLVHFAVGANQMDGAWRKMRERAAQNERRVRRFVTLNLVRDVDNGGPRALRQNPALHCPDVEVVVVPVGCESYYCHNSANVVNNDEKRKPKTQTKKKTPTIRSFLGSLHFTI